MKKLISLILTMCIISSLFCISVFAEEAQGEIIKGNLTPAITASFNTATKTLEIQGTGELYDVEHTDDQYGMFDIFPFYEMGRGEIERNTETLVIGDGITLIGQENFAYFTNLKSVSLPDTLKVISKLAFYSCSSLSSVNGNGVETVEGGAFKNCSALIQASFPKVTNLSNNSIEVYNFYDDINFWSYPKKKFQIGAFQDCSKLKNVNIPLAQKIGPKTFYNCTNLSVINENNCLDKVSYIGHSAFYNCKKLKSISLKKVTKLYSGKTKADIPLSENSKEVAKRAYEGTFTGCKSLERCYIPNVSYIGARTFYGCNNLKYLVKGNELNKVTFLGEAAFGNCKNLEKIFLPKVKKLHMSKWYEYDDSLLDPYDEGKWTNEKTDNGEFVTDVKYCGAFEGCTKLKTVNIPSVIKIGARAFARCASLNKVYAPKADYAGPSSFYNCTGIKSVFLPKVKKLGTVNWESYKNITNPLYTKGIFENCKGLKSVNISGAAIIAQRTFSSCASLTSINVGSKIKSIGSSAFYKCAKLKTVNIRGKQLSKVYSNAFTGISPKAVFNCPKKQLAKYKKLIKSKAPKTAVFRGVY